MTNNVQVNPFHIQGTIRDRNLFFGRNAELAAIWGYLRKGSNVSIVAPRRLGKSTLLWHIKENAPTVLNDAEKPAIKIETFYMDMQLIAGAKEFFKRLADELKADNAETRTLERSLEKRRVILCLDEFDRTAHNEAFPDDFFAILRGLSQGENLTLVVATKIPLIQYADAGMTSPLYNIFPPSPITLGPFTEDEAGRLLMDIAGRTGKTFTEKELSKALEIVKNYYPWNVQLMGWCWFDAGFDLDKAGEKYGEILKNEKESGAEARRAESDSHITSSSSQLPGYSAEIDREWKPKAAAFLTFVFAISTFYTIVARDTDMVWLDFLMAAGIVALYAWQFFETRGKKS